MDPIRKTSVIVADDYPLFRKAVSQTLRETGEFEVLGVTGDGPTALGLTNLRPDIALIDLDSECFDPLALLNDVRYRQPNCRVVMFMDSPEKNARVLMEAIRGGANGYLLRNIEVHEFIEQMRNVARGGMAASEKITSALAERLRGGQITAPTKDERLLQSLTRREYDVLCCLGSGMTNQAISEMLGLAVGTVKVHVKHLLKKTGFHSRLEVALWAQERGHQTHPAESVE